MIELYEMMLFSRLYEEAVIDLWNQGLIFGEMHIGMGEEALIASIVSILEEEDAMAVDHRSTPPFLLKGVEPVQLLLEFLGHKDGICKGWGGHMHLFSKEHMLASSGIVGASGPAAIGFALANQYRDNGKIAVSLFGEGANNQGMLLESLNLAVAWSLPVIFICKDNNWAISTPSDEVTGGSLIERAKGFGLETLEIDAISLEKCYRSLKPAVEKVRKSGKPLYVHAKISHREGHFLGDPLLRFHENPKKEFGKATGSLIKAVVSKGGARIFTRIGSLMKVLKLIVKVGKQKKKNQDPIIVARKNLKTNSKLTEIEEKTAKRVDNIVDQVLKIINEPNNEPNKDLGGEL